MSTAVRNTLLPLAGRIIPRAVEGDPNHWLIVQPDHLGDILLSQPAVELVRRALPNARLTAVVGPWSERPARLFWPVDQVVSIAFPGFQRQGKRSKIDPYLQLVRDTTMLRSLGAGHAIVLRADAWWAAWLAAGATPDVISSDDRRVASFSTRHTALDPSAHTVVRSWQISANAVHNNAPVPDRNQQPVRVDPQQSALNYIDDLLEQRGVRGPFAVIHPGSGAAVKEWPPDRWSAVAAALRHNGMEVVVTGSQTESALAERISSRGGCPTSLAGETTLDQLIALMSRATLVLGPDCGPLHVAVATGTSSVHVFGPSDPVRYGPWGNLLRHRVVADDMTCSRCGDLSLGRLSGCGCMLAVSVDDVVSTAMELLAHVT